MATLSFSLTVALLEVFNEKNMEGLLGLHKLCSANEEVVKIIRHLIGYFEIMRNKRYIIKIIEGLEMSPRSV